MQQCRNLSDVPPETTAENNGSSSQSTFEPRLLINESENLPDYYSSPLQVLTKRNIKGVQPIQCETLSINNDTWYTAAYETAKFGICQSGTFAEFTHKLNPTLANEQAMNLNDIIYYKTPYVAMEAAAARVIDSYSALKKRDYAAFRNDDSIICLRYCVEDPKVVGSGAKEELTSIKSSLEKFAWQLHAPVNFLENCFRKLFGSTIADCFHTQFRRMEDGATWCTGTFTDPITLETFHSGLVGKIDVEAKESSALKKISLDEAQVQIKDGKVYYPNEQLAKHAAAARAIDCYLFREGDDKVLKKYQLCLEEPYSEDTMGNNAKRDDYDKLLLQRQKMQKKNGRATTKKEGGKTFKSLLKSFSFQLNVPMNFLENCYRQVHGFTFPKDSFQIDRYTANDRLWFTATFTDPDTSEVFYSGLVRTIDVEAKKGATLSTPLGEAEVHIMDGKVYYAEEKFARHAAAARAIDNYLFREGSDELTKKCQLCLEDPYDDVAGRDLQQNDYEELLRQRVGGAASGETFDRWKFPGKSLSYELEGRLYKLHIPMQLLTNNRNFNGHGRKNPFRTEAITFEDVWHTATFTDPNTSEVFRAGIGRRLDVEKKQGAFLSPSLDEAENRVVDGKVYYRDSKLAKHAAAARAIDCYLYRDCGEFSPNQLCLEDPYEEGAAQEIDYDALATTRANISVLDKSHIATVEPQSQASRTESASKKMSMSFKSVAESSTFHFHVPVNFLEKCFRQVRGKMYPNESFQCDSIKANDRIWFTATFTDPDTSEVFYSGLVRTIDVEAKKGATLSTPLGEAEVHIMDGKVYYAEEKFARHAAAARAIDNYLFREGGDELTRRYQLCLEDPYDDVAGRILQQNDYDELLRQRGGGAASGEESNVNHSEEDSYWKLHIPLAFLKTYLMEKFGTEFSTENLGQESIEIGMRTWHTATFKDPNTAEVFPSGLVGPIKADQRKGMVLSPTLNEAEVRILDGKVYYTQYRYAKHAAAARAIDCYFYRDEKANGKASKYRLCLEDPYEEGNTKEIDYNTLVASRDNAKLLDAVENMMPYLDESDEDFTLISRTYTDQPVRVDQKLSTLGRIAEIWAETPADTSARTSAKITSFSKASRDPTENILNWFKRVDHNPSNLEQAMAFSQLCNKTLLALAKENVEKVINLNKSDTECAEIQKEATAILDKLLSISSQFASTNESVVNTETLNAYILCLSRVDVEESASAAEGLLKRMSEGKDNLPSPNTGTYNAVMKLWSLVDGEKGKDGVNDTFSHFQTAVVTGDDLIPNRDTFQILLAANSKEDNHFKYDLALASLERIKALSQDLCGETFIPGVDDYNAALKKTSTNCLADGDYQPPWFWHGQQYDGGFKAMDDGKKSEALDMEKWLDHAEEVGASPSEDMYFQVIKAWASTGSLEGLIGGDGAHGAEELAKKAVLRSEGTPNLKVFHPIIAAWSLCGEKLGPDRVKEWIDQISLLGMKPDLDLQVAYFVAAEKWQSKLIANLQGNNNERIDGALVEESADGSSDGDIESLFKAAQNCARYLKEITSDENRQDIADLDAFTSMLCYSIKAWSRASESALLLPDGSSLLDTTQGVEEMANILKLIRTSNHIQNTVDVDEALVNAAGKVYTEFISQLCKLDSTRNEHSDNNERCYFADRIADVESSLRSYEYHSRRLASDGKLLPESNDIRHNLYRETLRGCAGVKLSTDFGHMMRICTLIMDCLSWHHAQTREHGSSKEAEDVTDVYSDIAIISGTCVKNPYERMNVLRSIYDRASDFFPRKNPHHESSYARVDRAALLGSMRRSLGDSEMTDSFLSSFEEGKQGQRRRSRQRSR